MKVVLLAGGFGTRLSEETVQIPKPMVQIGPAPILTHIMMIYAAKGFDDFIIACGYKAEVVKEYFANFTVRHCDWRFRLHDGSAEPLQAYGPDWKVSVVDTGLHTMTGGRIKRLQPLLGDGPFMATYGDGVADLDVRKLLDYHRSHGKLATVTAVRPPARFGCLEIDRDRVTAFREKSQADAGWINGGYFVFEPQVVDYLAGDETILERAPLENLAADGQLMAYRHSGFWMPMDTLRDKQHLCSLWDGGKPPWRVWPPDQFAGITGAMNPTPPCRRKKVA